jgi:hypothetical protein
MGGESSLRASRNNPITLLARNELRRLKSFLCIRVMQNELMRLVT